VFLKKIFLSLLAISLLSGCTKTLVVTYNSVPSTAVLFEGNNFMGFTPFSLYYEITPEEEKQGYKIVRGVRVLWASGAAASLSDSKVYLSQGYNQQYTFLRPQDYPGLREDFQFALEVEQARAYIALEQAKLASQQEQFRQALTAIINESKKQRELEAAKLRVQQMNQANQYFYHQQVNQANQNFKLQQVRGELDRMNREVQRMKRGY
jgi:hypothetical protein